MAAIKQPSDKSHFILPDLGEGVHEAELIKWRVKPGESVKEHQILAEMNTDKALVEVPSPWAGTISELCGAEGEILKVGNVLVRYTAGGTAAKTAPATKAGGAASAERSTKTAGAAAAPATSNNEDAGTVVGSVSGTLSVSERFARARDEHLAAAVPAPAGKALATPAVRRLAREHGVEINRVPASGRGGRVTASDVDAFVQSGGSGGARVGARVGPRLGPQVGDTARHAGAPGSSTTFTAQAVPAPASAPPVSADGVTQRIPFRGVRRKIAEALLHSVRTTVHFTAVDEADVTALDRKRREYAQVLGQKLSFLPFVMTAVCRGLRKHPAMNANVDDANGEILLKGVIHLGCAVDTEHGLMVPVIRDADKRSIVQLAESVKDLATRCHARTVAREELIGGTFTISNVGSYGGMFATPIINYPEIGILAAGRVKERVLVKNGQFYAGLVMPLSVSADHRVVDGAEAVRFLNTVVGLLEDPAKLLG